MVSCFSGRISIVITMKSKTEIALRDLLYALKMEHNNHQPVRRSIYTLQKIQQAKEALKEEEQKRLKKKTCQT